MPGLWKGTGFGFLRLLGSKHTVLGQGFTCQTYHDAAKNTSQKEVYKVKDTIVTFTARTYHTIWMGNIESKVFEQWNQWCVGVWFETGSLRMRGILKQSANYGVWEYFYESGQKSMEGTINGKTAKVWTLYFWKRKS